MPGSEADASRWLRYAQDDLHAARVLRVDRETAPREICWLAQQAAEKAIKSLLIRNGFSFPRTHDLDLLRNLLSTHPVAAALPDLAELSEWAVESRYPGDWPEATSADADQSLACAEQVVTLASADNW